jgi:hypothetical protein
VDGEGGLFSRFENLTYYAQFGTKAEVSGMKSTLKTWLIGA